MRIEHVALLVADPVALAAWYVAHLGMSIVRRNDSGPGFARFLADSEGLGVLEIYASDNLPTPDYGRTDPLVFHVAFSTDDVEGTRGRLVEAGAAPVGEVTVSPTGDTFAVVRDPWGIPIQLAHRKSPLVG
jgi:catechol 2,3-dioxygenase-like lactoylglutathione lyase family enzyme